MFSKILIANRGEIACRIIRTARRLGVLTVAVYSETDAGALHVEMSDEAMALGGVEAKDSYLVIDKILQAAKTTGAEAIHPGYGFLSENPDFVETVEAAGLTFIGPSAQAIRAMGLKDAAKKLMEASGVPVVPGYHGEDQSENHLAQAADAIGYPVLIKAVAGGGGKGMRRVETAAEFRDALLAARREAKGAFGNDDVLIEKWITQPRHIEVQVFGDGTQAVHLYERDCSLQRRHQKVIEEAPAPGMTDEMRAAMGAAAVRAAEAIGYKGAGTVEFIVDGSDGLHPDKFWFMEMNTRLQVEHPVTEAITGIDLVEWQVSVASGGSLPLSQDDIPLNGHAFEARLYAEDVPAGFLPAAGGLDHLAAPGKARFDTGVRTGDPISPYFDPMIAKIIVQGPDRQAALTSLSNAISATQVAGVTTNLDFLQALTQDPSFSAGDVDTGLIERNLDALITPPVPDIETLCIAAVAALGLQTAQITHAGFSLWSPLRQISRFTLNAINFDVVVMTLRPGHFVVQHADADHEVQYLNKQWAVNGRLVEATLVPSGNEVRVFTTAGFDLVPADPLDRQSSFAQDLSTLLAPMPGLVRDVSVTQGARVEVGDPIAVLEAMKMEHVLRAARDGVVAELGVSVLDQVEAGALIARFEDLPDG
jgi:3-methylcrotonyl-CoA carboxylase alpha subunit